MTGAGKVRSIVTFPVIGFTVDVKVHRWVISFGGYTITEESAGLSK